jgi:hypothetical protein
LATALLAAPAALWAQTSPSATAATTDPERVEVTGRHYDNAVGSSDAASQGVVRAELLKSRPALRPGEVLEFVPGVIVTQHSGDGKANQYFLRGFNLDHGTDFATSVAGMPVNMPSHGHGQGYTDLNFLIPELVSQIAYRKGPYFASHGDFASAGAADIRYRQTLDAPLAQLSIGQRGYVRGLAAGSGTVSPDTQVLGALEWMRNDGPWTVPEGLQRHNGVLTVSQGTAQSGWSASAMAYDARWTSTDQVPQRLIDAGQFQGRPFGRFDSLDPSDGGSTSRFSLSGEWHRRADTEETQASAYLLRYRLKLFSNFSYALERPDTGDQFSQQDSRWVGGLQARQAWQHILGQANLRSEVGAQLRHDRIRVGLFDTQARRILATTREDDIEQSQWGLYAQTEWQASPWARVIAGLRADAGWFKVHGLDGSEAALANSGQARDSQVSPKLSVVLGPWAKTELFFNAGRGLHSNDARGTTAKQDPKSGEPANAVPGLVPAKGWELGLRSEAVAGLQSSLALWQLKSASELVYVGDAGATEASGASTRRGIEWNNRWTPHRHLLLDADLAWTHARFDNGDRIPNAVDRVASVAATLKDLGPWSASLQWRYLGPGALVEDNSVRSLPSSTLNLRLTRTLKDLLGHDSDLTLDVFNLTNARVNDIQYYYESRLPGEAEAVADRIVHPAEPRSLRVTLRWTW